MIICPKVQRIAIRTDQILQGSAWIARVNYVLDDENKNEKEDN
jgi:hypothetical protein